MAKNIYVGNLSYNMSEDDLTKLFSEFGQVDTVRIITDKATGQSKGFGFVEMAGDAEAEAAIKAMDGKEVDGRSIKVNEATAKPDSGGRGGFARKGGRGGGFGGRGGSQGRSGGRGGQDRSRDRDRRRSF